MNGLRLPNKTGQANDDDAAENAGTKKLPLVSIVILNWNGKSFLQKFLPFVLGSTYENKQVIVVDNASTDDSVLFLQQHFPTVKIVRNPANEGFAKGYNTALKQVKSDYYVLLNSDVEVTPGWIEPVIELMESNALIAACQPKIRSYEQRELFEYAGACGGWIDVFGYPFSRGRVFDICEKDNGQYDDAAACFWASGAAMFIRAASYHEAGGLDEYFFAHQEEIDLCWRLQLAGYLIFVQPLSVVYHVGGGTLKKESSFKTYLNFRNNLVMCVKNMPVQAALWRIPIRLWMDALAAWKGLLSGDVKYFFTIMKAHLMFIKWLLIDTGQSVFPKEKNGELKGIYGSSVVWQYFVKKKIWFSEIVKNK